MTDTYDTEIYRDYTITMSQDVDFTESPLEWSTPTERGATYALKHNRYELPFELDPVYDDNGDDIVDLDLYSSWTEFAEACAPEDQKCYKFVRWYEHSGISVSLRDDESGRDWDAGIVGVIFGTDDNAIQSTFSDFKHYTEGDIYSVTVEDPEGEFVDSLGCIYGYDATELEGQYIVDYALSQPRAGHKPVNASKLHK